MKKIKKIISVFWMGIRRYDSGEPECGHSFVES